MIASETNIRASVFPTFTGRDVPISELAQATGKSAEFLKRGLREGIFDFGYVMKSESGNQYRYFCPDKLVWRSSAISILHLTNRKTSLSSPKPAESP